MMSGRGYQQDSRDSRYRHNVPSNRHRRRRRRRKPVSNPRLQDCDTYPMKQTVRAVLPSSSRLKDLDLSVEIGANDSDSRSSGDYDGTPIPDHVWVGEYLDDGDEKDTVPLPYDATAKEISYKKALSEATASVRDLVNPIWLPENMARSSLPALMDLDIQPKTTRKVLSTEEMPPPMPRLGTNPSFPSEAVLKRYHDLYAALIKSIEYRAEEEEERSQLMNLTQSVSKPAEVYDYGHGESQATTSRERRGRRKSSEGSRYEFLKLTTGSDILDKRDQRRLVDRYEPSSRNKYRDVEPVRGHDEASAKRNASPESGLSRQRSVVPASSQALSFQDFLEFQQTQTANATHSSGQSLLPMSKPFTFQELCDLQKFLSQPTVPKPSLDESDENYIPVHTSRDKMSEKSTNQEESFPIRVLTSRRRSVVNEEGEDFPHITVGKSNEGRQPVVHVAPLRIKPILKKTGKNVKRESATFKNPSEGQAHYPQSIAYKGSFNDTRKVLLDAAKELESRSSKALHDKPLVIVRNAPLGGDSGQEERRRGSSSSHQTAGDSLQSSFPFNASRDDSGRKSDTDDEADRRRYERLFAKSRSPTPRGRRYVRSRSPSSSRRRSYTRSRSSSPGSSYHERRRNIVSPRKRSRERDRCAQTPPRRLVLPPGKSAKELRHSARLSDDDYKEKYHRQRYGTRDIGKRKDRSPVTGWKNKRTASHKEDHYPQSRRRHSPVVKYGTHGRKREDSLSSSDRSSSRNRSRDARENSDGWRRSPHFHGSQKVPAVPQKDDSRKAHSHNHPEVDLLRISVPADGMRQLISEDDSNRQSTVGHNEKGHTSEGLAIGCTPTKSSDFEQQHREVSLEHREHASEAAQHSVSVSKDTDQTRLHGDSNRAIKRPPSSQRSTERSVPHPPKFMRKSPSPLWIDRKESDPSHREVRRERRYQHEEMDSILQDEELPGLLSMEITPLPSLMDVDVSAKPEVKIKDERRFASRSVSSERSSPPGESKILHEERQKKKIITNPKGKIILKRRDNSSLSTTADEGNLQGKVNQAEKATAVKGKVANSKPKQSPIEKKQSVKKASLPDTNKAQIISQKTDATNVELVLDILDMESSPNNEQWLNVYKTWFHRTMQPVLENNVQAKDLGLQDPVYFLESVTKGNRRSLSFVPRGRAAKEILKFIAVNKKPEKTIKLTNKDSTPIATGESKSDEKNAANSASDSSTFTSLSIRSPDEEKGNKFFVIDKKPSDVKNHASPKTTVQDANKCKENTNVAAPSDKSLSKLKAGNESKSTRMSQKSNNVQKDTSKSLLSSSIATSLEETSGPVKHLPAAINSVKSTPGSSLSPSVNSIQSVQLQASEKPKQAINIEKSDVHVTTGKVVANKEPSNLAIKESVSAERGTATKKFRSWQDALLFPEDENEDNPSEVIKDICKASSSSITVSYSSNPKDSLSGCHAKPTTKSSAPAPQPSPRKSTSDSRKQSPPAAPSVSGVAPSVAGKVSPSISKSQRKNRRRRKTAMRPYAMQSKDVSTENNEVSTPLPADVPSKPPKTEHEPAVIIASPTSPETPSEKTDTDRSVSSDRRRDSSERRPFSKRNSKDNSTVRSSCSTKSKQRPSASAMKTESASSSSDDRASKAEAEFFTEPPRKPELLPEQESLLPDFKRQVDKSALRTLNILYKIENYKKYKVVDAAHAIVRGFNDGFPSKSPSGFTVDHALYYIWCSFQEPTKDALDDVKRQMRKIYHEDPCFDVSLHAFFEFQATVFNLCRRNLNRNIRYALQKPTHLKYVRSDSQYAFPQFDGEAHVMIKLWTWRERMYSISRKDSIHRPNARLKTFPEGDLKPMEERVAKWLKDVLRCPLYDNSEAASCELTYEVKRQLMKRKAHATSQEAIALIIRAWTRNYFYSIEKSLLPNSAGKDELLVLDEVYSEESDSDGNSEDLDIDIEEDLTGVQIDLF